MTVPKQVGPEINQSFYMNSRDFICFQPSVPDDDDRDFKRTRKTTDTTANDVESPVVSNSGDRHRKRKAEGEENRAELAKVSRDESGRIRGSSLLERDEQGSRNQGETGGHLEAVVYPIPSSANRDRSNRHQDGRDFGLHGPNSHEDSRGRRRSPSWDRRGKGRNYRDRFRDGAPRHGDRGIREGRMRRERCRDYDGKLFYVCSMWGLL